MPEFKTKTILIDGKEKEVDAEGNVYGYSVDGRFCRVSWHRATLQYPGLENQKLITCGHVYVLNYNPAKFKKSFPMTYKEYQESKTSSLYGN